VSNVNTSLNNTLEEELRVMLVQANNNLRALQQENDFLRDAVKEEQDGKYRAYVRLSDLEKELRRNEVNITLRRDGTASFPVQEGRTILVLPNADLSKVIPTP